jgi:MFS family permease
MVISSQYPQIAEYRVTPQRLIMLVFFLEPIAFGNWLARIPEIQTALGLSPAQMALAFLGMPIGVVLAMPFSSKIGTNIGAKRLIQLGFILVFITVLFPVLAFNLISLIAAMVIIGSVASFIGLGLNVAAAHVERTGGRLIMGTCHGFWSIGIAAGSFIGTGLAGLGLSPLTAMVLVILCVLPFALYASHHLPTMANDSHEAKPSTRIFTMPSRALAGICLFVFGISMTEGAMGDWSGIYLRDVAMADPSLTGFGYGIFASFVSAGRFLGDGLKARLGVVALARLCGSLAVAGIAVLGIAGSVAATLVCYAIIGFGVAVGFPLAVSAVSQLNDRPAAANVAILSMMSTLGSLIGPVMIGFVAEHTSMRYGLTALLPALIFSLLATRSLQSRQH